MKIINILIQFAMLNLAIVLSVLPFLIVYFATTYLLEFAGLESGTFFSLVLVSGVSVAISIPVYQFLGKTPLGNILTMLLTRIDV